MSRKRNNQVMFWVNDEELIKLKDKMSKMSCNPGSKRSDYIRNCALGKDIVVIPGLRDLIINVKSIISNLNQITDKINNGTVTVLGDNLKEIKEGLREVMAKLNKVIKKI